MNRQEKITKTTGQILRENICTLFNLLNLLIAVALVYVHAWSNLFFIFVIAFNTIIGIAQEIKAKRLIEKLSLLSAPKAEVERNGKVQEIAVEEIELEDILLLDSGKQICADATVVEGTVEVNESLLTGESDAILKKAGDSLLSGSSVISGKCRAQVIHVGSDNYAAKIAREAKKTKAINSELVLSMRKVTKLTGFFIVPLGVLLFLQAYLMRDNSLYDAVVTTSAGLLGMLPKGLYLLISIGLAAGIVALSRKNVLVQDLYSLENLAHVDVLCLDKTGTLTEGKMQVEAVIPLADGAEAEFRKLMGSFLQNTTDNNATFQALNEYFTWSDAYAQAASVPFSSDRKWSAITFAHGVTFVVGAPEKLCPSELPEQLRAHMQAGKRILLAGITQETVSKQEALPKIQLLAAITIVDPIRKNAPAAMEYFRSEGVAVKIISGDNPVTVSAIAAQAGVPGAEKYIDMSQIGDEDIDAIVETHSVFGRVTPVQKKQLVEALHRKKHTVAMTGDGVNDVLALREADCSIAMASGSSVACQASHIVLLDSDFSAMPSVVAEGRRVINNIERSASLYLVKNIFTFILAITTLIFTLPYPYSPAQLSLVNAITIGIPSFILAMEPNEDRISGHFLGNVLRRALPAALADYLLVLGVMLFYLAFHLEDDMLSTISTGVMGVVGLMMVFRTSKPFNTLRIVMMSFLIAAFAVCYFFFPTYFTIEPLNTRGLLVFIVFALLACSVFWVLRRFGLWISERLLHRKSKRNQSPS